MDLYWPHGLLPTAIGKEKSQGRDGLMTLRYLTNWIRGKIKTVMALDIFLGVHPSTAI